MINTLQIMIHMPLLKVKFPPNVVLVLSNFFNIVTFDFFDCTDALQTMFNLQNIDYYLPYNDEFNLLGYSFNSFILNLGMPVFFILGYLFLLICYCLVYKFHEPLRKWLSSKLFWSTPILFLLEMTLQGTISAIVNIIPIVSDVRETTSNYRIGDWVSLVSSCLFVGANITVTLISGYILTNQRLNLESEKV
jgi:hypothetical protein